MPCCSNSPVLEITVYISDGNLETEMSICSVILRSQTSFLIDCILYSSRRLRRLFKLYLTDLRSLQLIVNLVCFIGIPKPRLRPSVAWMKLTTVFVSAPLQYAPYPYTKEAKERRSAVHRYFYNFWSILSHRWMIQNSYCFSRANNLPRWRSIVQLHRFLCDHLFGFLCRAVRCTCMLNTRRLISLEIFSNSSLRFYVPTCVSLSV